MTTQFPLTKKCWVDNSTGQIDTRKPGRRPLASGRVEIDVFGWEVVKSDVLTDPGVGPYTVDLLRIYAPRGSMYHGQLVQVAGTLASGYDWTVWGNPEESSGPWWDPGIVAYTCRRRGSNYWN